MATPSGSGKNRGPIVDPGLCRCCRSIKKCRLLTAEYLWNGEKEIYSDMFMDCFGLLLSHLDGDSKECCICAACVSRLRDACAFRRQALQSEEVFLSARLETKQGLDSKILLEVKQEPPADDNDSMGADDVGMGEPDLEEQDPKSEPSPSDPDDADYKPRRNKKPGRRQLLAKMNKLRDKLDHVMSATAIRDYSHLSFPPLQLLCSDHMMSATEAVAPKREKIPRAKKKESLDHDNMMYNNAVTIVQNSYVCPFHNRISNYYCYYCKDQFVNPIELRDHTLSHDPKELFESMMENKKIPKIDITRIDCRLCPDKIADIDTFKRHITNTHGKIIYPVDNEFLKFRLTSNNLACTECNSVFPYFDMLKKHMIDHFGTYICDMCGACFLEQNSLRTHIKSHNKVEANFPCEVCGKNLKSKYSRYLHVATVHEKKPTVNCYKCEASFLSYAQRNKHLIEVHGDKRTFPCKLCDKVYNRRKTLMEHNRRNHLKVYRHQCDLCDQRFYLPSRLKEHMATHTGERNFRCEFCEKSYPRLQSLQEHIRSHSNDRRYKCDLCNSAFTQNGSLKNHMKSHHQGYDLDTSFS